MRMTNFHLLIVRFWVITLFVTLYIIDYILNIFEMLKVQLSHNYAALKCMVEHVSACCHSLEKIMLRFLSSYRYFFLCLRLFFVGTLS